MHSACLRKLVRNLSKADTTIGCCSGGLMSAELRRAVDHSGGEQRSEPGSADGHRGWVRLLAVEESGRIESGKNLARISAVPALHFRLTYKAGATDGSREGIAIPFVS